MATSGTYLFTLDLAEIIEEAFEQVGLEGRSGNDLETARRSLNLLLTEWSNHQVNLWTLEEKTVTLSDGTTTYSINQPVLDILNNAIIRNNDGNDTPTQRLSLQEYLQITDKDAEGLPTQFTLERDSTSHTLHLYLTPGSNEDGYSFRYWAIHYIEDAGNYTQNPEIPRRFLPALVSGLAWKISLKRPAKFRTGPQGELVQVDGVDINRRQELRSIYMEMFQTAREEDRERTSTYFIPRIAYR